MKNRSSLSHLETSALMAFIEVAERGSFTEAAVALNLSQPTVSQQVQRLEKAVGIKLLHRRSNRVCLSPAGEAFITHCRTALSNIEIGIAAALQTDPSIKGKVTLGLTCFNVQRCLSRVLQQYRQHHPEVMIDVLEGLPHELVQSLQDRTIDLAIVSLPIPVHSLKLDKLYDEPLLLVTAPQHPLATIKNITWHNVCCHPLLLPRQHQDFGLRCIVERLYQDHQSLIQVVEVSGGESLRQLLSYNYGMAFLPLSQVQQDLDEQRLMVQYPLGISLSHTVAIATHSKYPLSPVAQALADALPQLLTV